MSQPLDSMFTSFAHKTMLRFYLLMLAATATAVLFIDRPLSTLLYDNPFKGSFLKLLSQTPLALQILAVACALLLTLKAYREKLLPLVKHLILTALLASLFRWAGKLIFGRTWPETWVDNNPSWIHSHVEAFHPFAAGPAYNAFPSGHTLFTVALACCFWHHFPQYRIYWSIGIAAVFLGQLGQNYHFLGDTLAGATLGVLACHLSYLILKSLSPNHHNSGDGDKQ
ncbi:phosphatase PAP2 family protein [Shewanella waksmanii]|uniref:phosphatase PAP2 family protein n=1 Tax=Shewanella waksmanii TaxID=213783 RepID=UPI003736D026